MVNIVVPYTEDGKSQGGVSAKLYQYYPDMFRVVVMHSFGRARQYNTDSAMAVNNQTTGTNIPVVTPKLATAQESQVNITPSDILELFFLHELGHGFCCYFNNPSLNLENGTSGHFSTPATLFGQMATNNLTLTKQPDGDYMVSIFQEDNPSYASRKYSNWELYAMGLAPATQVESERFLVDLADYEDKSLPGTIIPASATMLVGVDDLVNVYGPRVPSFGNANTQFPTVFIGLSEEPMTDAEVALFNRIAIYFASDEVDTQVNTQGIFTVKSTPSFYVATGGDGTKPGAGTMTTLLPTPQQ
jgi:hypothetical protein